MRKMFFVFAALLFVCGAFSQKAGDVAVGANIVFTLGWVEGSRQAVDPQSNNGGFGGKLQYNVTDPVRVEGAFNFLPSGDRLSMWDLSVNAHYLIHVMQKLNVYPVAGLNLMKYTSEGKIIYLDDAVILDKNAAGNYTIFGVNIGGGIEYKLSKKVSLQGELKYLIGFDNTAYSDYYKKNRFMISLGAVYKF